MVLWNKILLHRPSWLWIFSVAQACFELMSYLSLESAGMSWDSDTHHSGYLRWFWWMCHLETFISVSQGHNKVFRNYYFGFLQVIFYNSCKPQPFKGNMKKIRQNCKSQWFSSRPRVFRIVGRHLEKWKTFRALECTICNCLTFFLRESEKTLTFHFHTCNVTSRNGAWESEVVMT